MSWGKWHDIKRANMKTHFSVSYFWVSLEAWQGIRLLVGSVSTAHLPGFQGQFLVIHSGSCECREQTQSLFSSLWFPMELPPTGQNCSSSKLPLSVRQRIVNRTCFNDFFFFSDLQPQCSVRKHFKKHAVSFLIHSSFHPEKKTIIWCFSLEIFFKKIIFWFTHTHTQNTLEIELPYDPAKSHCWVYTLRKPEFLGSISQQGDYSWWYCTLYLKVAKKWSESHSVVSDSLWLHGL